MQIKKLIVGFIALFMLGASFAMGMAFSGAGNGTQGDPYQITSLSELNETRLDCSSHYKLMNNIDASATYGWSGGGFYPMCQWGNQLYATFDGNNKTISNLKIYATGIEPIGLFQYQEGGSVVHDLHLVNVNVSGTVAPGGMMGAITARFRGGTIRDCTVSGTVYCSGYCGGVVGFSHSGSVINNTHARMTMIGSFSVGGLIGNGRTDVYRSSSDSIVSGSNWVASLYGCCDSGGSITESYAKGSVSGSDYVAGLVGRAVGCTITDSYSWANVTGGNNAGGLVGYALSSGSITDSYSTGVVSGGSYVGGLIGRKDVGITVTNSYWDNETSGQSSSAAGTGLPTSEMFKEVSFSGWDFVDIWTILEDVSYPELKRNPQSLCSNNTECGLCEKCVAGFCTVQTDTEDLKNECSQGFLTCANDYTLQGGDGFCTGGGVCDVDDYLGNVSAGNVCIAGSDTNPTNNTKCNLWYECILHNEWASGYYVGYAGDGTSSCVSADWQSAGVTWNATAGWWINVTENASVCQEELYYTVPGAGAYVSRGSGEWPEDEPFVFEEESELLIDIEVDKSELDFLSAGWEDQAFVPIEAAREEPPVLGVIPGEKEVKDVIGIVKFLNSIRKGFNSFIDFFRNLGFYQG